MVTVEIVTPSGSTSSFEAPSGELLRRKMLDNKQELYIGLWAKAMNCGGAGTCGTCLVEVLDDNDELLSGRTANEDKKLNGKPASWRLACQAAVGDGETSGKCKIRVGPK